MSRRDTLKRVEELEAALGADVCPDEWHTTDAASLFVDMEADDGTRPAVPTCPTCHERPQLVIEVRRVEGGDWRRERLLFEGREVAGMEGPPGGASYTDL